MRKIAIIILWILLIFTPVAGVSRLLTGDLSLIDYFISKEWAHVIAHLGIFFGLGVLLTWALQKSPTWMQVTVPFLIILLVGLGQEAIQLIFKNRAFGYPEVFDLFVDLGGGFSGIAFSQVSIHLISRLKDFFNLQAGVSEQPQDNPTHNLHQ